MWQLPVGQHYCHADINCVIWMSCEGKNRSMSTLPLGCPIITSAMCRHVITMSSSMSLRCHMALFQWHAGQHENVENEWHMSLFGVSMCHDDVSSTACAVCPSFCYFLKTSVGHNFCIRAQFDAAFEPLESDRRALQHGTILATM